MKPGDPHGHELPQAVRDVLAVLPPEARGKTAERLLRLHRGAPASRPSRLLWTRHGPDGRVRMGGSTDIVFGWTRLHADPAGDEVLARIVRGGAPDRRGGHALTGEPAHLTWAVAEPADGPAEGPGHVRVYVDLPLFAEALALANPDAALTRAEARAVFQFVGGLSFRAAARSDAVSPETKRKQFKTAATKLACSGQADVLSLVTTQLSRLVLLRAHAARADDVLTSFAARAMGSDTRIGLIGAPRGGRARYLDCGPVDGTPILVFHGILFPIILLGKARLLGELGLRLIAPVRAGYMDGRGDEPGDALAAASGDAAAVLDALGVAAAHVLGSGFGVAHATRFALEHPARCRRLIALTPYLATPGPAPEHPLGSLLSGVARLAGASVSPDAVLREVSRADGEETTLLRVLDHLVGPVEADRAVLRMPVKGGLMHEVLAEAYRLCVGGVARDMREAASDYLPALARLSCPITVLRGTQDVITTRAICERVARANPNARLVEVPGGGQFVETYPPTMRAAWRAMIEVA